MEGILNAFFENFSQLERTALHARHKRQAMVEYFSTLIQECRPGEDSDPQKTCRVAIVAILRYHEKSMKGNGGVCMMGKCHNVLYVAIKLCYDWQLKDNPTVAAVLDQIYLCEKTFERIWVGAVFGITAPYFVSGWKSDFDKQEDNFKAVVYFLDHAANAVLEYPNENGEMIRYIDIPFRNCSESTPLKIVLQLGLSDKVHILLRYGATCDDIILQSFFNDLVDNQRSYPRNLVACLRFILRTSSNKGMIKLRKENLESFNNLIEDCLVPLQRCGVEPSELKHLCRCSIRKRLRQNYQLPNGIKMLPLPEILHRYLDLLMN